MKASLRVYIAAPKVEVIRARLVAERLRAMHGVDVCSTWHVTLAPSAKDPTSHAAASAILAQNLRDLGVANVVLGLVRDGCGAETYVEFGRALATGTPVVLSSAKGGVPLSWADRLATVAETDSQACERIRTLAASGTWR